MAAFSSFQQYQPFLLDPLVLPTPNSIDTSFKLDYQQQPLPNTTTASDLNSLFCPPGYAGDAVCLDQAPIVVLGINGISHQNETSAVMKQSTTTTSTTTTNSSSAAATDKLYRGEQLSQGLATSAVNSRRRKTRHGSGLSPAQSKERKSKRQKKGREEKEKKEEKKGSEEPPKDYIHVRARRGQATDSHSLAERVRREKISERMKILQKLVPGCDKVTGKALMLDEIINYVQSLQNQVEFLSMKLASLSPVFYDFGVDLDALIVRPEGMVGMETNQPHGQQMGPTQAEAAFRDAMAATTAPPFPSPHFATLLDNPSPSALSLPHISLSPPLSQDNINGNVLKSAVEQRQKFLNTTGFTNDSLCSFH